MNSRLSVICIFFLAAATAGAQVAVDNAAQRVPAPVAQDAGSNIAECAIAGTVLTVDGKPVRDARVELKTFNGDTLTSTYSLPNGTFGFSRIRHGRYEVVVTQGIQQVRQLVEAQNFLTEVSLRMALPANDGGNSVSVGELKVPHKAVKLVAKAEDAFRNHKLREARKQTEKALAIAPSFARALTLEGVLDLNDNRLPQAEQELQTAIRSDSGYGMAYVVLGAVYNMSSRFDAALRALRQGITIVPNSWQAYFESAKALLGKGQYKDALRNADRAAQFAPNDYPPIHLVRAHALLGLKAYRDAAGELEQYLGREPNGVDSANARQTLDQVRGFLAKK
jgi:predicted Zn-dependent protease